MGCVFGSAAAAGPNSGVWAAAPDDFGALLGAKEVGADLAASAAALTASDATGAPPTCASIGEPPGRVAAAALRRIPPSHAWWRGLLHDIVANPLLISVRSPASIIDPSLREFASRFVYYVWSWRAR